MGWVRIASSRELAVLPVEAGVGIAVHLERLDRDSGQWIASTGNVRPGELIRLASDGTGCLGQPVRFRLWQTLRYDGSAELGPLLDASERSTLPSCTAFVELQLPQGEALYSVRIDAPSHDWLGRVRDESDWIVGRDFAGFQFSARASAALPPEPTPGRDLLPGFPKSLADVLLGKNTLLFLGLGAVVVAGVVAIVVLKKR